MKKINALTDKQIAKFPEYVETWVKKGLTTARQTQEDAVRVFTDFQVHVLQRSKPAPVVLLNSPSECWEAVIAAKHPNVTSNEEIRKLASENAIVYPYFDCQFWAGWCSFYEFFRKEVGIEYENGEAYNAFIACQPFGMVWPLEELCVVCQPPTILKVSEHGLHCEDGPAVSYNGRNELYALNGVVVPKELVMTPTEELTMEYYSTITNADVKAEFVRKFGVERMVDKGSIVDTYQNYDQEEQPWWWKSQYELWDMASIFPDIPYQPYLKMLNQTTGIWHMEAVSPNCRNLIQAIKERFGGRDMKIVAIA